MPVIGFTILRVFERLWEEVWGLRVGKALCFAGELSR